LDIEKQGFLENIFSILGNESFIMLTTLLNMLTSGGAHFIQLISHLCEARQLRLIEAEAF
jgi:hypothetical protein